MSDAASSPPEVDLEWTLTGRGWARCTLRIGTHEVEWSASYIIDSLADLTTAAAALLEGGAAPFEIRFEEEPQIVVLKLTPDDPNIIELTASRFFDRSRLKDGEQLLRARCDTKRFARAVSRALARLQENQTEASYREAWGSPFPSTEHDRLKQALRKRTS